MPFIPHTLQEQREMFQALGINDLEDLFVDIPKKLRLADRLNLPQALTESELIRYMTGLAQKNYDLENYVSFLGAGAYDHLIPAVIGHLINRGEFLTAYTPYQAEVSQGVLQAIFEFQTLIANLTGMDYANASMYDGATALAEACLTACNETKRSKVAIGANLNPQWQQVLQTYLDSQDIELVLVKYHSKTGLMDISKIESEQANKLACLVVAQPNFFGGLEDMAQLGQWIKSCGGLLISAVDPLSLGLLKSPGDYQADIVVGDAGCFGNSISFGGPSVGFFAVKGDKLLRRMPGRIVGQTQDRLGNTGYVLTLQTREQHIRREKATSNICTNQALNALAATMYLALLGKSGIKDVAYQCVQKATYLKDRLVKAGFNLKFNASTFKEFVIKADVDWEKVNASLVQEGYIGGLPLKVVDPSLEDSLLISVTESRTRAELDEFARLMEVCLHEYS